MEEVERLYQEYQAAKNRAEQYMFVFILLFDKTIENEYKDLKENFTEEHRELFVKNVKFMLRKIS